MVKKTEEAEVQDVEKTSEQMAELAALETAVRPIAGSSLRSADQETLSHQWQAGSPAVDTNVLSEHPTINDSIMSKIDTPENIKAREESAALLAESGPDYDDCSKLDVSDARYCQPGSERHKAFLKKKDK